MNWRAPLLAMLVMVAGAALIFYFFQRQLSRASLAFGAHPEVVRQLETALADRKRLAELDPANEAAYRSRFAELETTVQRLRVLEHNRDRLVERYQLLLLAIFAGSMVVATSVYVLRQARQGPRLERLSEALAELARGRTDLSVGDRGGDAIGRIAAMVERTSRVMARDRRRLAALRNLSSWQEAARRQAHEMGTPLTAAQLELTRVRDALREGGPQASQEIDRAAQSAAEELARLSTLTRQFTSFARLPRPEPVRLDLLELVREFVATFESAWANLELAVAGEGGSRVVVDRDMIRQVLVNLCDNASQALGERRGRVEFRLAASADAVTLDVRDDGPGVATEIRLRLFEPYATTRTMGQGMGLGLAISRKILLDHEGDLELAASSERGACFRLSLPRAPEETG